MSLIKHFYETALYYCDFISKTEICSKTAKEYIEILMKLYIAAMSLTEVEPDTVDSLETNQYCNNVATSDSIYYWEIFDPFECEESVGCTVYEDIISIAEDLYAGIREYEEGRINNAVFEWSFSLYSHYGRHIVDCLRALHFLWTKE